MKKLERRDFKEARSFVHKLNLKSIAEWSKWAKSADRPKDIPLKPNRVYKNEGWLDWFDWLGKNKITWQDFEEARSFVHKLNFRTHKQWQEWSKSSNRPQNIPSAPNQVYKSEGWVDWSDWLNTNNKKSTRWRNFN